MKYLNRILVIILSFNLIFTSVVLEARSGSRFQGGRSYHGSFGGYRAPSNFGRQNQTNYQRYHSPGYMGASGARSYGQPYRSMWQNHPFMTSIMAGLAGSWIGNMLFNQNTAVKNDPTANQNLTKPDLGTWLGSKLPLLLLVGLAYFLFRRFRQSNQASSHRFNNLFNTNRSSNDFNSTYSYHQNDEVLITQQDNQQFAQILTEMQTAWSQNDLTRLKQLSSPELFNFFAQTLRENTDEGVRNKIEQVQLMNQEVQESWREQNLDYVNVKMVWRANDYFIRINRNPSDSDYIADGDPQNPVSNTEIWTFQRGSHGPWTLAGIQQV